MAGPNTRVDLKRLPSKQLVDGIDVQNLSVPEWRRQGRATTADSVFENDGDADEHSPSVEYDTRPIILLVVEEQGVGL